MLAVAVSVGPDGSYLVDSMGHVLLVLSTPLIPTISLLRVP